MRAGPRFGLGRCLPAALVPLLVPLSVFGAGTSTEGRLAVAAVIGASAVVVAVLLAARVLPFRWSHVWIALLACLLLVSFAFPQVSGSGSAHPERHRIGALLGIFHGMTPFQLSRITDLAGLFAGLGLLAVVVAWAPCPRQVSRLIALNGAAAAGYVLVRGTYNGGRLEGLGCNANYLGILLALAIVAAVGLARYARDLRWLAPAAICFVALADTQSRGAFLAAAAGVAFVLVQGRSRRVRALLVSAGAAFGVAVVTVGGLPALGGFLARLGAGDRKATEMSANNHVRGHVAEIAVRVIAEHPLRGIGYWMFPAYAERSPDFGEYLATHNDYLRLGAEAGVPALAVLLLLLWLGARHRRTADLAVLKAVVVGYGAALVFANPLANLVVSAPFWIALGCLLARGPAAGDTGTEAHHARPPT